MQKPQGLRAFWVFCSMRKMLGGLGVRNNRYGMRDANFHENVAQPGPWNSMKLWLFADDWAGIWTSKLLNRIFSEFEAHSEVSLKPLEFGQEQSRPLSLVFTLRLKRLPWEKWMVVAVRMWDLFDVFKRLKDHHGSPLAWLFNMPLYQICSSWRNSNFWKNIQIGNEVSKNIIFEYSVRLFLPLHGQNSTILYKGGMTCGPSIKQPHGWKPIKSTNLWYINRYILPQVDHTTLRHHLWLSFLQVTMLKSLDHVNLLRLHEAFRDGQRVLVFVAATGMVPGCNDSLTIPTLHTQLKDMGKTCFWILVYKIPGCLKLRVETKVVWLCEFLVCHLPINQLQHLSWNHLLWRFFGGWPRTICGRMPVVIYGELMCQIPHYIFSISLLTCQGLVRNHK